MQLINTRLQKALNKYSKPATSKGFTIVELLIVVVVIAVLASITVVAYNGISTRAKESSIKSSLNSAYKKLETYKTLESTGSFPTDYTTAGLTAPSGTSYAYTGGGSSYCLQATSGSLVYYITNTSGSPTAGACVITAVAIQTITTANCPTSRGLAFDARDGRSYWVQRLSDNKCWMLTNLAYAGGGTNTYSDVRTLTNTSGHNDQARYWVPTGSNPTTSPATPSLSTDAGATNPQYGYLYNWCAAKGGQATAACSTSATTPTPTAVSVCPAGWRLPTGGASGEFVALTNAINGGDGYGANADAGLRSTWLGQYAGSYDPIYTNSYSNQGVQASYWSSDQQSSLNANYLWAHAGETNSQGNKDKRSPSSIRCIAQ